MQVVHVGYHKTGSTWLQRAVFPLLDGIRYEPGYERGPVADGTLVSREGLSGTLWGGETGLEIAERLATDAPGARILVFVRRQEDMLASIYGQYVNEGGWRGPRRFLESYDVGRFEYHRLVARYRELFDQVKVIPYERMRDQPDAVVAEIAELCGARLREAPNLSRWNPSLSRSLIHLLRVNNRLFRRSPFNPHPPFPVRPAKRLRPILQWHVQPRLRHSPVRMPSAGWDFTESNALLARMCDLGGYEYATPNGRPGALPSGVS